LEWFQDVGGGPQNGSLQAMRGWLPGAGFSPRQPPKFCRNIRNNCRKPCGTRQRAFRITRNTSATRAKLAGDSVAQRELNRNAESLVPARMLRRGGSNINFSRLPGDEFIGSLPDFFTRTPLPATCKIFFLKNLLTQNCDAINLAGLQEK
jgi:hypothetical protein